MLLKRRKISLLATFLLTIALALGVLPGCMPSSPPVQEQTAQAVDIGNVGGTGDERPTGIADRALKGTTYIESITKTADSAQSVPDYDNEPGIYINGNIPSFSAADLSAAYGTEEYGALDQLGRCTSAFAIAGPETEPTAKRGDISHIHPSGWRQAFYPELGLDHLYERSHMLAHCLTAEDANERNLITGTNYMNQGVMQTLEQKMDSYIDSTGNHIALRVTPIFHGAESVARGVQMEAYSLEDDGDAICLNMYLYNVQPGVEIDYATGESRVAASELANTGSPEEGLASAAASVAEPQTFATESQTPTSEPQTPTPEVTPTPTSSAISYVLNTNTHKFHYPDCRSVSKMKDKNKSYVESTREDIISRGYIPCGNCNP